MRTSTRPLRARFSKPASVVLAALLAAVAPVACSSGGDAGDDPGERRDAPGATRDHIHLIEEGRARAVGLSSESAAEIVDFLCERIVAKEMVVRVAMNTESIDEIKAGARCIEAVLAEPRELTAGNTGQVLAPTRLLVPLTGKYASTEPADNFTIFHGDPEYARGSLPIKTGRDSLLRLLASHGMD